MLFYVYFSHGQSKVAKHLIQHGCKLNIKDKAGLTLMALVIRNLRLDCEHLSKLLVHAGYNLAHEHWLKPPHLRDSLEIGTNPEHNRNLDVPIPHGRVEALCNWMREKQQNPDHLSNLCRICVRRSLQDRQQGCSIIRLIPFLPIPNSLKDFIMIKEWMY